MTKFRKILLLFIITALITALTGCSGLKDGPTPPVSSPTNTATGNPIAEDAEFNYSQSIDKNGFWENVRALDYVELKDYKGISIPKATHTISAESLQMQIDQILAEFTVENKTTDRAVKDSDTVNIDFVGSVDGVEFAGGNTQGMGEEVTIGVTNYIDDFLEQLIGHTPGESFNVEVTFPDEYQNPELEGKDAVFAVTLNYIIELVQPEYTDEFVAEKLSPFYGWTTIKEMEKAIQDTMQQNGIYSYIQNYLSTNMLVKSVPETLLKYQDQITLEYFKGNATNYNMTLEELFSNMGIESAEDLFSMYAEENAKEAEMFLIYQAIAEDAGIKAKEEDIIKFFKKYMGTEDYSEYEEEFGMPYIMLNTLNQLVIDYLSDNVVLEQ